MTHLSLALVVSYSLGVGSSRNNNPKPRGLRGTRPGTSATSPLCYLSYIYLSHGALGRFDALAQHSIFVHRPLMTNLLTMRGEEDAAGFSSVFCYALRVSEARRRADIPAPVAEAPRQVQVVSTVHVELQPSPPTSGQGSSRSLRCAGEERFNQRSRSVHPPSREEEVKAVARGESRRGGREGRENHLQYLIQGGNVEAMCIHPLQHVRAALKRVKEYRKRGRRGKKCQPPDLFTTECNLFSSVAPVTGRQHARPAPTQTITTLERAAAFCRG